MPGEPNRIDLNANKSQSELKEALQNSFVNLSKPLEGLKTDLHIET